MENTYIDEELDRRYERIKELDILLKYHKNIISKLLIKKYTNEQII